MPEDKKYNFVFTKRNTGGFGTPKPNNVIPSGGNAPQVRFSSEENALSNLLKPFTPATQDVTKDLAQQTKFLPKITEEERVRHAEQYAEYQEFAKPYGDSLIEQGERIGTGWGKIKEGKTFEGGSDAILGIVNTLFGSAFLAPNMAIGELKETGEVGKGVGEGIEKTVDLPFEIMRKILAIGGVASEGILNLLGTDSEELKADLRKVNPSFDVTPGFEKNLEEATVLAGGMALMGGATKGAKNLVKKQPLVEVTTPKRIISKEVYAKAKTDILKKGEQVAVKVETPKGVRVKDPTTGKFTTKEVEIPQTAKDILTNTDKYPTPKAIKDAQSLLGKDFKNQFEQYKAQNKSRIESAKDPIREEAMIMEDFARRTVAGEKLGIKDVNADLIGEANKTPYKTITSKGKTTLQDIANENTLGLREAKIKVNEYKKEGLVTEVGGEIKPTKKLEGMVEEVAKIEKQVDPIKQNRLISDDFYQQARQNIITKGQRLSAGIDPTLLKDYATIGLYHLENGVISFRDWSKKMIEETDKNVRPYLRAAYKKAKQQLDAGLDYEQIQLIEKFNSTVQTARKSFVNLERYFKEGELTPERMKTIEGLIQDPKRAKIVEEQFRAKARSEKHGKLAKAFEEGVGEQAGIEGKKALEGELPRVKFEPVRQKFTQEEVTGLFDIVNRSKVFKGNAFDRLNARDGLAKMLQKGGGDLPTPKERVLLSKVFGEDLVRTLLDKRTRGSKFYENLVEAVNIPRAMMSAFDMSAPFRQGLVLTVGHPLIAIKNMGKMHKDFFKEDFFQAGQNELKSRPNRKWYDDPKEQLQLTGVNKAGANLSLVEESMMSRHVAKIPGIRSANRAYLGFLNRMRADVFDYLKDSFERNGYSFEADPRLAPALNKMINISTGRGGLAGLEKIAPVLNGMFFSPRNFTSKIEVLAFPFYKDIPKPVRIEHLKNMSKLVGAGITVLKLAEMAGADVETNPLSTDFGKIKVGNTRIDIWGGEQQFVTFMARQIMKQRKSTNTGRISEINRGEDALRFLRGKASPQLGIAIDYMFEEDFKGDKVEFDAAYWANKLTPLMAQDAVEAVEQSGVIGLGYAVPAFYGFGVQTYGQSDKKGKKLSPASRGKASRSGGKRLSPASKEKK